MQYREPETKAQQFIDEIFNATGAITTHVQDLKSIAFGLQALGIPAGDQALELLLNIRAQAIAITSAFGAYTHAQANGTLYHKPEKETAQ